MNYLRNSKKSSTFARFFETMEQKRKYINPKMYVEACLGRECWMLPSISGGVDPKFIAPRPRKTDVF